MPTSRRNTSEFNPVSGPELDVRDPANRGRVSSAPLPARSLRPFWLGKAMGVDRFVYDHELATRIPTSPVIWAPLLQASLDEGKELQEISMPASDLTPRSRECHTTTNSIHPSWLRSFVEAV